MGKQVNQPNRFSQAYASINIQIIAGLAIVPLFLLMSCNLIPLLYSSSTPTPAPPNHEATSSPTSLPIEHTNIPSRMNNLRLVGYYSSWSIYARGYQVGDIPAGMLTHVNYAFTIISEDGQCISGDERADETNFPALKILKQSYPNLKTLISVGGRGTAERFSQLTKDDVTAQKFVSSCLQWMQQNGFDGIDVDWEFPSLDEKERFTDLLKEFRREMDLLNSNSNKPYLLTIAAGASPYQYDDLDLSRIADLVDWINLMAYDFHGPWSELTGFNAPLYTTPDNPAPSAIERETFNIHTAVQAYLSAGVPAEKIVLGVPFYGYGWQDVPVGVESQPGLFQSSTSLAPGSWGQSGVFDYKDLVENYLVPGSGYIRYWHTESRVPWLYNRHERIWITYDDPASLTEKANYVKSWNLGGIMVWQLSTDDSQNSLLNSLYMSLVENN